jgi:hypothetical protein
MAPPALGFPPVNPQHVLRSNSSNQAVGTTSGPISGFHTGVTPRPAASTPPYPAYGTNNMPHASTPMDLDEASFNSPRLATSSNGMHPSGFTIGRNQNVNPSAPSPTVNSPIAAPVPMLPQQRPLRHVPRPPPITRPMPQYQVIHPSPLRNQESAPASGAADRVLNTGTMPPRVLRPRMNSRSVPMVPIFQQLARNRIQQQALELAKQAANDASKAGSG